MTEPTSLSVTYVEPGPLAPDDPRLALAHATQVARAVVERIDDDAAGRATPCGDWDVLDVARHVVGIFHRVAAAPSGADLASFPLLADVEVDALDDALAEAAAAVHAAWSDATTLERIIEAPFGPTPGAACLMIWSSDVLVHVWDLATALAVDPAWPPATGVLADVMRAGLPAEGRAELPFDDPVEVGDDAAPIARLVAWSGRDPGHGATPTGEV